MRTEVENNFKDKDSSLIPRTHKFRPDQVEWFEGQAKKMRSVSQILRDLVDQRIAEEERIKANS